MRAIKIPVDGAIEVVDVDITHGNYDKMWELYPTRSASRVSIGDLNTRRGFETGFMYVDESGKLVGLPTNDRAGILYGTPVHGQEIAGDVYLFGEAFYDDPEEPGYDIADLKEEDGWTVENLQQFFDDGDGSVFK